MTCASQEWLGLLSSYQLDLLDMEDRRRVEEHVLECDACFEDLYGMAPAAEEFRRWLSGVARKTVACSMARKRPGKPG